MLVYKLIRVSAIYSSGLCAHSLVVIHEGGDITLKHHHTLLQVSLELWLDLEEHALHLDDLLMKVGPEVAKCVHTLQIISTNLDLVLLKKGVALLRMVYTCTCECT